MPSRPPWPAIRTAYLNGEGSIRALAERFAVSENTLEKRAAREGWRKQHRELCGKVVETAEATAEKRGVALGERAAAFVERTLAETERWMDCIENAATQHGAEPDAIVKLVRAWRDTISVGRAAYRLDESAAPASIVNLAFLQSCGAPPPALVGLGQ
jgi:hypothetical protein